MNKRVLIVDDDVRLAKTLACEFEDHDYQPWVSHRISEIPQQVFDFAVVDLRLVGEFGLDAIEVILKHSSHCRIVVLSGYGSVATAVEAVKRGAVDYLLKPASFQQLESAFFGKAHSTEKALALPSLSRVEHEYIEYVLTKNQGNITKTAKDLGLHRQSLQRKLKKFS